MRLAPFAAVLALTLGLSACAKCDVPTWSLGGLFAPSACSAETPRR
jgi:hypothetical protein